MGRMPTKRGHLHVTVPETVLDWLRARSLAEDEAVSTIATRILRAAMEADRERYAERPDGGRK